MPQDFQVDDAFVLLCVPTLRPRQDLDRFAPSLRFLDPGLKGPTGPYYRPDDLPLNEDQVAALMARYAMLAREVRSPGELDGLRQGVYDDFHANTSFAIRDQLAKAASGDDERAEALRQARIRAQTLVCLSLTLEEEAAALNALTAKLDAQWQAFEKSLDLGDETLAEALGEVDPPLGGVNPVALSGAGPNVPASTVVEAVLALVPPEVGLFSDDAELRAAWEEFGAEFLPCDSPGLLKARVPGFRLALSRRASSDRPWLDAPRDVYVPKD
ncbi:hypothetical protein [Fundidesulfovibrio butyratiphilus]